MVQENTKEQTKEKTSNLFGKTINFYGEQLSSLGNEVIFLCRTRSVLQIMCRIFKEKYFEKQKSPKISIFFKIN